MLVLVRGDAELGSWPLVKKGHLDLSVVDELARLQVAAHRVGCAIRLRYVSAELWELLDLVGLGVEVGGEAEGGEQVDVEEVVMPDDPVA